LKKASGSPRVRSAGGVPRRESFQELFAQPVETSVGHDKEQVAGLRFGGEEIGNGIGTGEDPCVFAERADGGGDGFWIKALVVGKLSRTMDAAKQNFIAERQ
jgi:hypothetical protein